MRVKDIKIEILKEVAKKSLFKTDFLRNLGCDIKSTDFRDLRRIVDKHKIDISHFVKGHKHLHAPKERRICVICGDPFDIRINLKRESLRKACSVKCGNILFQQDKLSSGNYKRICFVYHKKECIICGEDKIVAVHHYDENHKNNKKENLIPLCPTHHQYFHSKYRSLVEDKINDYRNKFLIDSRISSVTK